MTALAVAGARRPRILCVAGARPNYMKIKPVMDALESRGAEVLLVHTGQHYDTAMNDVFFEELDIRAPDHFLGVGSGGHAVQTARVMMAFEPVVLETRPDLVVVVGDVNSTLACALVAAKLTIPVAHVEAGLRSRDWEMPEEVNRIVTDRISTYLLAPSPDGVQNLLDEAFPPDRVHLVGNVMVDTLLARREQALRSDVHERVGVEAGSYGLVTLHRPSSVDDASVFGPLVRALAELSDELPLVFPVHPRTSGVLDAALAEVGRPARIHVMPPAGYLDFVALQAAARVVLTDSGGVQEETTVLGVPCLTLRDNTERPITVTEGTNQVVGRHPADVLEACRRVLHTAPEPRRPALWDGRAGERIADVLLGPVSASTAESVQRDGRAA